MYVTVDVAENTLIIKKDGNTITLTCDALYELCSFCGSTIKYENQEGLTREEQVGLTQDEGLKYDDDKLRWDLLPLSALNDTVRVITFGAKKYGPNNWQAVKDGPNRYLAAALRHIVALQDGEKLDPESGIPHVAHAITNLVFVSELARKANDK
jgi:hypothetical protein